MESFILLSALVLASGCSTLRKPESPTLQGMWQGKEIGGQSPGACYVAVSPREIDFRGADPNEWYQATYTLRGDTSPAQIICVTIGCSYAPIVGSTCYGIFQIEQDAVRVAISEPGQPAAPAGFDAPGVRQFVFTKK